MGSIYRPKYKDKKTGKVKQSAVWWICYYRNGVKIVGTGQKAGHFHRNGSGPPLLSRPIGQEAVQTL